MSELGPTGGANNPFGSFLGDLMKMLMTDGPLNWQLARQAALMAATGGVVEPNVDPLERLRLEELLRVADLHVSDAMGMQTSQTGRPVTAKAVTMAEWAYYSLDAYRGLFEGLAEALTSGGSGGPAGSGGPPGSTPAAGAFGFGTSGPGGIPGAGGPWDSEDPTSGLLGSLPQVLAPVMLGAQAGLLAGQLARRAFGQYELPIPRPPGDELLLAPATIATFAEDWSLRPDDVRLWVCLSELAHHALFGREHVRARLDQLLHDYVTGFAVDHDAFAQQLEGLDLSDMSALPAAFGDPDALLGAMQTPAQEATRQQLRALISALEGYVDHVLDTTGQRLIGNYGALAEAMRRRRAEPSDADKLIERLLGVELRPATFDRGNAFVQGVLERAGDAGLARLWHSHHELPTPAEVDAPGLWLERIDLND